MAYSHFLTLCEYLDKCEREKAKYSAFAFNDPKFLFKEQKEQKQLDLRKQEDREKLLMLFNGK